MFVARVVTMQAAKSLTPPTLLKAKLFNQLTAAYKSGCIHLS
jgi:hypothetical protein